MKIPDEFFTLSPQWYVQTGESYQRNFINWCSEIHASDMCNSWWLIYAINDLVGSDVGGDKNRLMKAGEWCLVRKVDWHPKWRSRHSTDPVEIVADATAARILGEWK
jgi:hypothetical protein